KLSLVKEIDEQGVVVFIKETDETEWIDLFQFTPIPLTEEILLKCGFEIDGNFCYIKSFQSIYLAKPWREANHFLLKTIGGECLSRLQHLHQLQNLYFALCGEELEVNLQVETKTNKKEPTMDGLKS